MVQSTHGCDDDLSCGALCCRRGKCDFRRADAVLKALNVTSGRHVVAEAAPAAAPAETESALGLFSPPATQPGCSAPAQTSAQPVEERPANGHALATGAAPCRGHDEHAGSVLQHSAQGDEDDRAAMGAATKRLKLDGGVAGVALKQHRARSARD